MKTLISILILIAGLNTHAFIEGLEVGLIKPIVDTAVVDKDSAVEIISFKPNNPMALSLGLKTSYGTFGHFLNFSEGEDKAWPVTKIRNYYFKGHLDHFELRLSYFKYRGALIEKSDTPHYYEDFEQIQKSAVLSYYVDKDYLELIQFNLTNEENIGILPRSLKKSFFASSTYQENKTIFPSNLLATHRAQIEANNDPLPTSVSGKSIGAVIGIDGLYKFTAPIFMRLKGGLGLGYRLENEVTGTTTQYRELERILAVDFSLGHVFSKNKSLIINADVIAVKVGNSSSKLENTVTQFGLIYAYYF